MLFNSIQFALFLPAVFLVYWLLRRKLHWQNAFVVAASYLFYGWWNWRFLLLIAFTSGCSFLSGLMMERPNLRKAALWSNAGANLLVLGVFKYYDFFASQLALLLGLPPDRWLLGLVLPVGISFYTFQALSYSIDVYRGTIRPTHDAVAFFAYVSFFPQLVAGPIERAQSLLPQFEHSRQFDPSAAADGMRQMLWGLFKKMVVADSCAVYVDQVFAQPDIYAGGTLAVAAVLFSIQIYGDFSGYSDVAIGCAKLFGIKLRLNFAVPYFARDIAEFWRRWHMSLTSWFRDYVYIPLGGSRTTRWKIIRNTLVVFLLSGLWHGANWTFLAWGLYHALLFMPLILTGRNRRYKDAVAVGKRLPSWQEATRMTFTFICVTLGWIVFRSPDVGFAVNYIGHLFGSGNWLKPHPIVPLSVLAMAAVEWHNRFHDHGLQQLPKSRAVRWCFYIVLIFTIVAFMPTDEMPFLYFQF